MCNVKLYVIHVRNAMSWIWIAMFCVIIASHVAGGIEDSRISLAAFLGIGTIVGLMIEIPRIRYDAKREFIRVVKSERIVVGCKHSSVGGFGGSFIQAFLPTPPVPSCRGMMYMEPIYGGPVYDTQEKIDAAVDILDAAKRRSDRQRMFRAMPGFIVIAAFAVWGVLKMNHGALRTFLGFVGGVAAFEATVSPLMVMAFPTCCS